MGWLDEEGVRVYRFPVDSAPSRRRLAIDERVVQREREREEDCEENRGRGRLISSKWTIVLKYSKTFRGTFSTFPVFQPAPRSRWLASRTCNSSAVPRQLVTSPEGIDLPERYLTSYLWQIKRHPTSRRTETRWLAVVCVCRRCSNGTRAIPLVRASVITRYLRIPRCVRRNVAEATFLLYPT